LVEEEIRERLENLVKSVLENTSKLS